MDLSQEVAVFLSRSDTCADLPDSAIASLRGGSNVQFLDTLAQLSLDPRFCMRIVCSFESLLPEICARWPTQTNLATLIAAFGRVICAAPYMSEVAAHVLDSLNVTGNLLSVVDGLAIQEQFSVLLGLLRLFRVDNATFSNLIRPATLQVLLGHQHRAVRYLAARLLCLFLHASDASFQRILRQYCGSDELRGAYDGSEIDYAFLDLWEQHRLDKLEALRVSLSQPQDASPTNLPTPRVLQQDDLSRGVFNIGGVLMPGGNPEPVRKHANSTSPLLVNTTTTTANMKALATALQSSDSVLITGPAGSGKSITVNHIASCLGKASSMVTLHLNEQSDAKSLLGIYTTGDEPGSFHWQPGVLTTSVLEGRWVLIEDLDRAPTEVLSILVPLLERRQLRIPGRDTVITAKVGFKMIATMRVQIGLHGQQRQRSRPMLGAHTWQTVSFDLLAEHEIRDVIMQQFPILSKFVDSILEVFRRLQKATQENRLGERERPITSRDLIKWSSRIASSLQNSHYQIGQSSITDQTLDEIFLDAVDCFLGTRPEHDDVRASLVSQIATALDVDPNRRDYLSQTRIPPMKVDQKKASVTLHAGRASLSLPNLPRRSVSHMGSAPYSLNRHSSRLMEAIGAALVGREPLLLVGETGIGKTSAVQHMSTLLNQPLLAINLSQQSEVSDLIGGYKPVSVRSFVIPLKDEFDELWEQTFSESTQKNNEAFTNTLAKTISKSKWKNTVVCFREAVKLVDKKLALWSNADPISQEQPSKRRKIHDSKRAQLKDRWISFSEQLDALESRIQKFSGVFAFSFVEGKLVNAVREGSWVLLDEINLASPDTLECLSDLLEAGPQAKPSLLLSETGSTERVEAHPNFRLIAAMNPSTDIGKRDLPPGIRSRFTELYVESLDRDRSDLEHLVQTYVCQSTPTVKERQICSRLASLFSEIQSLAQQGRLLDGSSQKPQYSLRTLTRSLQHAVTIMSGTNLKRALYEGFSMCFSTCLGTESFDVLDSLISNRIFEDQKFAMSELRKGLNPPKDDTDRVSFEIKVRSPGQGSKPRTEKYWLPRGSDAVQDPAEYIVTPYIGRNLKNLIRAASTRKYPVLIQGPTSAGKTSMVEYLAKRSGNRFVRINNHEHTDLQEYLGTYVSNAEGRIVFQEGVLVEALKKGYWVVLDELNLAPTDILEALNRLLDDNRELFIPETQEVVKPHSKFMLFATQNPVGAYGGRKILSRAFRNRFLELHFDDIPVAELNVILAARSELPESWCTQIIDVYKALSQRRHEQRLFEQTNLATLRDLFRWAFRGGDTIQELARNGALLLVDKVRDVEEREFVRKTIESVMSRKGIKLNLTGALLYSPSMQLFADAPPSAVQSIVWTNAMSRLASLVTAAIKHNEPVLLVGETGGGKTTICQIFALASQKKLYAVNAHQNMETGDLIGAQRPVRNKAALEAEMIDLLNSAFKSVDMNYSGEMRVSPMILAFEKIDEKRRATMPKHLQSELHRLQGERKALFKWHDGALVQSMREGDFFLLDEISLADDSVLERMNSVLDPQRSVLLAEKGAHDSLVTASPGFQLFATMNPGGDFGKKELSPALRNRFTEIWVPPINDKKEVYEIVRKKIRPEAKAFGLAIVEFATWFDARYRSSRSSSISIRDILSWINFVNLSKPTCRVETLDSVIHGAMLVYIDTLGANPAGMSVLSGVEHVKEREVCLSKLGQDLEVSVHKYAAPGCEITRTEKIFFVGPFGVDLTKDLQPVSDFQFEIQTTRVNAMRILRGLQVDKPILIEGAPGVGKTSLVTALATSSGHNLTRINLSDQTDLIDLFGSDVPVDDAEPGTFTWRDAPFLKSMKSGGWVLLDEMNLASQPILEGLNACIDHRGEVYIPELDRTFKKHPNFRLFAAQNPQNQGGGRKGLPLSFVNRFTVVFADTLTPADLNQICSRTFPEIETWVVEGLVAFIADLELQLCSRRGFGINGGPWEFNLRDAIRTLSLLQARPGHQKLLPSAEIHDVLDVVFMQRFRSPADKQAILELITSHFGSKSFPRSFHCNLTPTTLQIGLGLIERKDTSTESTPPSITIVREQLPLLESIAIAMQVNWPVLLVGGAHSKMTEMVSNLAAASGSVLDILSISTDVDASDLIGSFEQVDPLRQVRALFDQIEHTSRLALSHLVETNEDISEQVYNLLFDLSNFTRRPLGDTQKLAWARPALRDLVAGLDQHSDFPQVKESFIHLESISAKASQSTEQQSAARFQWIDSALVRAIEEGHWLVLENANLCSASVLDRLNSLLEPNSVLTVNENCAEDGTAREIVPHPDFRIFLTVDPQYGEISRAMRNRALELFVPRVEKNFSRLRIDLDSTTFRFRQSLAAIHAVAQEHSHDAVVLQAFQSLSRHDLSMLGRFRIEAQEGLLDQGANAALARVMRNYAAMVKLGCNSLPGILEEYNKIASILGIKSNIEHFQPSHPLINQPFSLALGKGRVQECLLPLALLHDVQQASTFLQIAWEDSGIDLRISKQRLSSSATSKFALVLKDALSKLGQETVLLLKNFSLEVPNPRIDLRVAQRLISYWMALFRSIGGEESPDDFVLEACVLSVRNRVTHQVETESSIYPLVEAFSSTLDSVSLNEAPTTGLSMAHIWTVISSGTIHSRELLREFLRLEQLARTVDDLSKSFRVPVTVLSAIRAKFIDLGSSYSKNRDSILPLLGELETTIEEISRSRAEDSNLGPLQTHFGNVLAALYQTGCLSTKGSKSFEGPGAPAQSLETLSSIRTEVGLRISLWDGALDFARTLYKYFYARDARPMDFVLAEDVPVKALQEANRLEDVRLDSYDLLQAELGCLGQIIGRSEAPSARQQLFSLTKLVAQPLYHVLHANNEFLDHQVSGLVDGLLKRFDPKELASSLEHMISQASRKHLSPANSQHRKFFESVVKSSLVPGLHSLASGVETACWSDFGHALLAIAVFCLQLYTPDRMFDPVQRAQVDREVFDSIIEDVKHKRNVASRIGTALTGQAKNLRVKLLDEVADSFGPPPTILNHARPDKSQLYELQVDFNSLLRVIERARSSETQTHSEEKLLGVSQDADRIIARLSTNFRYYDDLVAPAIGFMLLLKVGCLIQARFNELAENGPTLPKVPFLNCRLSRWHDESCSTPSGDISPKYILDTLKIYSARSSIDHPSAWPITVLTNFGSIIEKSFRLWKRNLSIDQKEAALASNSYHYRGGQEDLEEEEQQAFNEIFPSYEAPEEENAAGSPSGQSSKLDTRAFPMDIATQHMQILLGGGKSNTTEALLSLISESGHSFASHANARGSQDVSPLLMNPLLLALGKYRADSSDQTQPRKALNIYTDNVLEESLKLRDLTVQTHSRASDILSTWPEHATLHNIRQVCSDIFAFKHKEPLVKLLTKTEQLHAQVAEWQTVASREFTMVQEYNALTTMIVSWRRLELSTWSRLLDLEAEKATRQAGSWFFVAYESLVSMPFGMVFKADEAETHVIEIVKTVESLIRTSSLGQFKTRLDILRALQVHLDLLKSNSPIASKLARALSNLVAYFSRFSDPIQTRIDQSRKALESQIKDVVQLASWRDVNITSLRQSAKTSHRKLFNVIRKYRELLTRPVSDMLGDLPPNDDSVRQAGAAILEHARAAVEPFAQQYCEKQVELWQERPLRFRNVTSTTAAMVKMVGEHGQTFAGQLVEFAATVEDSAKQLRDATPNVLPEGEKASSVKHLQARKRRLYADTLKALKDMGFKHAQTPAVLLKQRSLAVVLAGGELFWTQGSHANQSRLMKAHEEVADYFAASLDATATARSMASSHSEEITQNDIMRSIGMCEGILALSLNQRRTLEQSCSALETFRIAADSSTGLWSDQFPAVQKSPRNAELTVEDCQLILRWIPSIISTAQRILQTQARFAQLDLAEAIGSLQKFFDKFEELKSQLPEQPAFPEGLVLDRSLQIIGSVKSALSEFEKEVHRLVEVFPPCETTLLQMLLWTSIGSAESANEPGPQNSWTAQKFDKSLYALLDQVLRAIEDVKHAKLDLPADTETDAWLIKAHTAYENILSAFNIRKIYRSLSRLLGALASVGRGHQSEFDVACASITLAAPIIKQYQGLYEEAISSLFVLHRATSKMHYKLTTIFNLVATQGFCKPADKANEQDKGNEKLESGTGLGEGEAAEDISKDIAEDEDLSELAQDAQNAGDEKNEGQENQDNAVDIDDEMAGGAGGENREEEEVEEGESKEKGDDGSEQEETGSGPGDDDDGAQEEGQGDEGMDEGVGEVDDLEPSAVDEKFWDQAGEDDKREKEGKQSASNKDQNDQAAGKDESKQRDQDAEAGDDDQEASDASESGSEAEEQSATDDAGLDQKDVMDPHVHASEDLELPEDLNLDGDKDADADQDGDDDDIDMDALSNEGSQEMPDEAGDADFKDNSDPEEDDDNGKTAPEQDMDVDGEEDEARNGEDPSGQDTSEKPYASEEQGNQDMDPTGTAQGTEGTEMMPGASQAAEKDVQQQEGNEEMSQQPEQDGVQREAESQPAGTGEQGRSPASKAAQEQTPRSAQQESIKKLGDILERWHQQHRQINESSAPRDEGQAEKQDVNVKDADFEHLPDDEAQGDAQALGAAEREQARALDDTMAVPNDEAGDNVEQRDDQFHPDVAAQDKDSEDEDIEMKDANEAADNDDIDDRKKSMIGERAERQTDRDEKQRPAADDVSNESMSEVNDDFETMQLEQQASPPASDTTDPHALWAHHEALTMPLSLILTEQLRLILTPTQATKLRGDFRTGKRLNLKRIIPYIASSYRRDKIWLRRAAPSKRTYQIQLAIDDSRSMRDNGAADLALSCLALVARALAMLEAGELGVLGFGEDVFVAHALGAPFAADAGPRALSRFAFAQTSTDVRRLVARSVAIFREARLRNQGAAADTWQLQIVVSDGICEDHGEIRRLLLEAAEERIMFVFIVVDATAAGPSGAAAASQSIMDLERVEFVEGPRGEDGAAGEMKLVRKRYLDTFPFRYFLVCRDVRHLPDVLAGALRSWFAEVAQA